MQSAVLTLLLTAAFDVFTVHADAASSLVGGYCRIGKYTPVEVTHNGVSSVIDVEGALPVQIRAGLSTTTVVPVLTFAEPTGKVKVHTAGDTRVETLAFRVLSDEERLVGIVGNAKPEDVQFLFPGKRLIGVTLDAKRLLPGTWAAWEVLDAIVHGSGSVPGADDAARRALLGGGTSLVVRSPRPPDSRWPWSQRGDWWILHHNPLGPGSLASESAYLPVRGWPSQPGAGSPLQIIGLGILMMVGVLTAWRARSRFFRWSGVLAASLALIGIVLDWSKRGPTHHEVEGTVAYFNEGMLQHDFWEYRSPAGTDGDVSCECLLDTRQPRERWARVATRPVLAFPEQAIRQQLTLEVDVAGEPQQWTARLGAGEKLAFVTRLVDPYPGKGHSPYSTTINSPLAPLVREAYLVPGVHLTGQGYPRTDKEHAFAEVFLERDH